MLHPIICTCTHNATQHPNGGPCTGRDSYGLPCECPSIEPDAYWNNLPTDGAEEHHEGPQKGSHRPPGG